MREDYLKLLQETFGNLQEIDPEKVRTLIGETTRVFHEMQEAMKSGNPEGKEAAEELALQMKDILETQMQKLMEMSGFSPEELKRMAQDPSKLKEHERNLIAEMKEQFKEFQPALEEQKGAKVRVPKLKIVG